MTAIPLYAAAALAELAGCYCLWAWLRLGRSALWLGPGIVSLVAFAWLLTLSPASQAGRAYAAYGGVYIAASLLWLWAVEGRRPDGWDLTGAAVCLVGAAAHPLGTARGLSGQSARQPMSRRQKRPGASMRSTME